MSTTPESPQEGEVLAVRSVGYNQDVFYDIHRDGQSVEIDMYTAGSGLLSPGDVIKFPEPTPATAE